MIYKVKSLFKKSRFRFARADIGLYIKYKTKQWFGGLKNAKVLSNKHNKTNVCKNGCACASQRLYFYIFYVMETPEIIMVDVVVER